MKRSSSRSRGTNALGSSQPHERVVAISRCALSGLLWVKPYSEVVPKRFTATTGSNDRVAALRGRILI